MFLRRPTSPRLCRTMQEREGGENPPLPRNCNRYEICHDQCSPSGGREGAESRLDPEVRRPIGRPFLRRASILLCAMKDTIFIALRGKGGEEIASAYYLGIL